MFKPNNGYREKVLATLKASNVKLDIETIRIQSGIKSWVTAKSILLELLYEKAIEGEKTSKSWVFWVNKTPEVLA